MIQILGLRPYTDPKTGKEKKKHKLFQEVRDVPFIFRNLDFIVQDIPESERWNIYYTALDCKDPKTTGGGLRRFVSQKVIPFDVDGINTERVKDYIDVFFSCLGLDHARTGIVFSGNGLQFIVELLGAFDDPGYYDEHRVFYQGICGRLDRALASAGLPGNADPMVWSASRILRLPGTENRKPKKGNKQAYLINGNVEPQEFDWKALADIPDIPAQDQIVDYSTDKFPTIDADTMLSQCDFLRWTNEKPSEVREPHFYAALSILARLPSGSDHAIDLATRIRDSGNDSSVAGFSESDIETKLEQALSASGPRTCKGINAVWGKCKNCMHFNKLVSPVTIKSEDHIASQENGFHTWIKGKAVPCYNDLLKFFDQKFHHKTIDQNGMVYGYNGTHYEMLSTTQQLNFAQEYFRPMPTQKVRVEFQKLVTCSNLVGMSFFGSQNNGKLNLKNGVLDLKTKSLTPHTPEIGFRYCLPYDYDSTAKAPMFEKFLDDVTQGDKDAALVLKQYMGYALSGDDYWIHKCLLLSGAGSNGKGVFIRLLKALAGGGNYSAVMFKELGNENKRQLLEGKLFNIAEEIGKGELRDTALLKLMTGNGEMTVKMMWNQPYMVVNRCKMIFSCNSLPSSDDDSGGYRRRLIIVPFNKTFSGENDDPFIYEKIAPELSGILNICLEAYEQVIREKHFVKVAAVEQELEEYSTMNNDVRYWLSETECVEVSKLNGRTTFARTEDLHEAFMLWATGKGRDLDMTPQHFSKLFTEAVSDGRSRKAKRRLITGPVEGQTGSGNVQRHGFFDVVLHNDTVSPTPVIR